MRVGQIGILSVMFVGGVAGLAQHTVTAAQATPGDPQKGQVVYAAQKCSLCHKIADTGGKLGPDLTKVGATRDAAWLKGYLPNPKAADPKNKMPPTKAAGAELDDLIAYLLTLTGTP